MRRSTILIGLFTLASTALAHCGAPAPVVPGAISPAQLQGVAEHKRGQVSVFDDLYGDPILAGITTGPDGALWFTDVGNDVIGRITTQGQYTLSVRAGAELADGIVTGPDGNLWFTEEEEYGGIGRITPKGVVKLFADPGGEYPNGITVGPDNALWFAESNGTVGRMTTKGKVTHFTVAASNATLQGIVTGPDGRLWVTEYVVGGSRLANAVIALSTDGTYKTYDTGSGRYGAGPDFICVGPDKALWFAEAGNDALGRMTTSGKYSEFPTNYEYGQPSGIVSSHGALWFTDFAGRFGIGRMTTSGKTTFYKVPGSDPEITEIATGPGNALWFTSSLGPSAIGRIQTR
ncbi:MAG TPA: hypothetical protein VGX91_02990 [Candidatus Cybelea sp.]|nr:hypothetical protein [Candidatus Cybelea sp.]